ncbi:hypothetical protein C9422_19490 [Pseudomonas sp. B1(2018)]|nr:hypothetical protein C9422_19490 [Pseudomonas sp. B1(2018)]
MVPLLTPTPRTLVGTGLLAKAVCQSALILNDKSHSRASPLPQGVMWRSTKSVHSFHIHPTNPPLDFLYGPRIGLGE